MVRWNVLLVIVLAACSKQSGEEASTAARASDTASGSELSSQRPTSATQPSDSSTYSSVTTTYSAPQTGTAASTGSASTMSSDGQQQSAAADATPRLKPPQPGTIGTPQSDQGQQTDPAKAQQPSNDQMANVDVEAIRSLLIREHPNRADTIRALTITEDNGIVTLRGLVLDESARPAIITVVERTPGVKQVRDELTTRTQ